MHNLIMRFKMHRLLKLINKYWNDKLKLDSIDTMSNSNALEALKEAGCIDIKRAWGGEIIEIYKGSKSQLYLIERSELWFNRICSYIFGLISGLIIACVGSFL